MASLLPHYLDLASARAQRDRRLMQGVRIDAETCRLAKASDGALIVPAYGSRFIDRPERDLIWAGFLLCLICAVGTISVIARFVAVL